MIENSTFNTDVYEKAVISFKTQRRVLVKYGKVSKFKITRYYVLQNEFLLYYKNAKCEKSISSFSLANCSYSRDSSKIKKINYSIKIITSDNKKTFWLHPIQNDELSLLERYIKFVSEGKFNNDQIIQQLLIDPLSKQEKLTSVYSSHLQIAFTTANQVSIQNTNVNRSSQQYNQEAIQIGKLQTQVNKFLNGNQAYEEDCSSENIKNNINMSYYSQMRQLEPQTLGFQIQTAEHKFQQQKQCELKQIEIEQIQKKQEISQTENYLYKQNTLQQIQKTINANEQIEFSQVNQMVNQNSQREQCYTNQVQQRQFVKFQATQKSFNDKADQQNQRVCEEEQFQVHQQFSRSIISPNFNQPQGGYQSNLQTLNNLQSANQQNNEYLVTLGQMSQNNMFTNQANISVDNKQNISYEKFNGNTISQIFKNMDNNFSPNPIVESGNFISSPGNFKINSFQDNSQNVKAIIDKDISAIIKQNDQSNYLDIDADLKFSSDEEYSQNKNEKLESVRLKYESLSPNANKGYLLGHNQQNNNIFNQTNTNKNQKINQQLLNQVSTKLFQQNIEAENIITTTTSNNNGNNYNNYNNQNHNGFFFGNSNTSNVPSSKQLSGNPTCSTSVTQNVISPQMKQFRYSNSLNNMQNFQNHQIDQNKNIQLGPCNLSSSTLQNIIFPESQKYYTESPQGSFFSHKVDTNSNFQDTAFNNTSQRLQQQKQKLMKDHANLSDVHDLSEQENISSDDEEKVPSTQFFIKQQVFYAGASKIFMEDGFSSSAIPQQSQRNSRIGVISNYSFDNKTISDTDLFDQVEGNFQKSATDAIQDEEKQKKIAKQGKRASENLYSKSVNHINKEFGSQKNQEKRNESYQQQQKNSLYMKNLQAKTNLRYVESNAVGIQMDRQDHQIQNEIQRNLQIDEDAGNYLDDDDDDEDANPAIANNVTYIIEKYKEQNYNEKNVGLFNVNGNNYIKKTDLSTIMSQESQIKKENSDQKNQKRVNNHLHAKSTTGFRQNASNSKRSLSNITIDTDKCNNEYNQNKCKEPQIKDKKEFYNKKNIIGYIVPKMEDAIPYLNNQQDDYSKNVDQQISVEKCYSDGYYYLWSFQFVNSHEIFKIYREENINFEYALLEHNLLKIIVTGSKDLIATTEQKFAEFYEYLTACQKDIQKKGDKSTIRCLSGISQMTVDLIKSETYLVRGLLQAFLNNKFQSFIQFKNAYQTFQKVKQKIESAVPKNSSIHEYLKKECDIYTKSRFYFISGLFNIGLSMIPSYFLKILSLIGIQPNKQYGYECLEKCIELQSIRSSYASLLLCIEYIELNPNVEKSILLIKKMIKALPQCPLFYWMASLLSWRYAKPDDALNLINKSLWNCGEELGQVSFYLKFEKGWYNVSQFDWKQALDLFQEIVLMAIDIDSFDMDLLNSLAHQKKLPEAPQLMMQFIEEAKNKFKHKHKIILPHKCCLIALVACCYENQGLTDNMNLWFLMTQYLIKKNQDHKTGVDEDISKLCTKYINRQNKQLIKYEILYFVKEITKLREDMLNKMVEEIQFYYESEYGSIQDIFFKNILKNNSQKAIDFCSTIFLRIVSGCLQQDFNMVYQSGKVLDKIAEFIPTDHHYILHHSYHWLARCQLQQNLFSNSKENLKKCLKYKKCEFTLENKSQKLLSEIDFAK
ncbi:hypothetical protein ABPG72_012022 [Tetrahymena utriculariae]